jgi:hypothetical protein
MIIPKSADMTDNPRIENGTTQSQKDKTLRAEKYSIFLAAKKRQ